MASCAELVGVVYTRPRRVLPFRQPMAGSDGIEPPITESKSVALPLGEPPIIHVVATWSNTATMLRAPMRLGYAPIF